jgi:hypothetical protein
MTDEMTTAEKPPRGSPESAAWFRAALEELGETQSSLARLMHRKGDDRKLNTILRTIQRMATGDARVSGEMRVILTMMQRAKDRAVRRNDDVGAPGAATASRGHRGKRSAPDGEKRTAEKRAGGEDHSPSERSA